jgi:hypothetical protein
MGLFVLPLMVFATPAQAVVDGKVAGLNVKVFDALVQIKKLNPNIFTELDGMQLRGMIMADGKIDDGERDLLEELTSPQFRAISVTPAGSSTKKQQVYPTGGPARKIFVNMLSPPLNLEAAWARGEAGWNELVAAYKNNPQESQRIIDFVSAKADVEWAKGSLGDGYKPLRDFVARLHKMTGTPAADSIYGRQLISRAMEQSDMRAKGQIPDMIYNWVMPRTSSG